MLIEMYADVICPWAYVGKRHVDHARAEYAKRGIGPASRELHVVWRPFLIDPSAPRPSAPLEQVLEDPGIRAELDRCAPPAAAARPSDPIIGTSVGIAASNLGSTSAKPRRPAEERARRADEVARELGIAPVWAPAWRANSWAAQRMLAAAASRGWKLQAAVAEHLMCAHFVAGDDVASLKVLNAIAKSYGLPASLSNDERSALAYMEPGADDGLERQTRESYLIGLAQGVDRSPTFIADGVVIARGAQPPDVLLEAFEQAIREARPVAGGGEVGAQSNGRGDYDRIRHAEALIRARNPYGALYLLDGMRSRCEGDRGFDTVRARALLASANLSPARATLAELLERYPHDTELHLMMGHALRRLGDPGATAHLAMGGGLAI